MEQTIWISSRYSSSEYADFLKMIPITLIPLKVDTTRVKTLIVYFNNMYRNYQLNFLVSRESTAPS